MVDINDNSSENYEQVLQENDNVFLEYLTNIKNQCATVTPDIEPTDFIKEFVTAELRLFNRFGSWLLSCLTIPSRLLSEMIFSTSLITSSRTRAE